MNTTREYQAQAIEPSIFEESDFHSLNQEEFQPYDPKDVNISFKIFTLDYLLHKIENDEINLEQRGIRWSRTQQSRLIESILIRIPIPAFYFDGSNDYNWVVIDGIQRLQTFSKFIKSDEGFKLEGLEFLHHYTGARFKDLPRDLQRRILEAEILSYLINPGTPPMVKFSIFQRINTGGLILKAQEIRDALNPGVASSFLGELANLDEFKAATSNSIPTKRMEDREYVLRFIAFTIKPEYHYTRELDSFLNYAMWLINDMQETNRQLIKEQFVKAMRLAREVFGEKAFRKPSERDASKKPLNKGLFEAWSVNLARLTNEEVTNLITNRDRVNYLFKEAIENDKYFKGAISSNTNSLRSCFIRFETIRRIIQQSLK